MKSVLIAALLALLLLSTSYAQSPRDRDATVYLQISRVTSQGGTIKGAYNGTPVEGTYTGGPSQGTFTLMANGMLLASGSYTCDPSGCVFSGK